jgi:hypothetical protein
MKLLPPAPMPTSSAPSPGAPFQTILLAELKRLCELPDEGDRRLHAAQFYRDKLGWAVHPLCGPRDSSADEKARGKKPLLKNWKQWTLAQATDELLAKYFGNGLDANLGIVVRNSHVVVDLDSKADGGESVRAWLCISRFADS